MLHARRESILGGRDLADAAVDVIVRRGELSADACAAAGRLAAASKAWRRVGMMGS
jgi:hypothetical protein